jgi:hypothetical protein
MKTKFMVLSLPDTLLSNTPWYCIFYEPFRQLAFKKIDDARVVVFGDARA